MEEQALREAVMGIRLSRAARERIVENVRAKTERQPVFRWRRAVLAGVAALLCLALVMPALASAEPTYRLLYAVSPAAAQFFRPVRLADEDNGVRMEVEYAYIHGDTAEICLTLRDLTGDRVDRTTDLFDSYDINTPSDLSGCCLPVGYDPETGTASFLAVIKQWGGRDVEGDKITFTLDRFLSHKTKYEGVEVLADLDGVGRAEAVYRPSYVSGASWTDGPEPQELTALVPGETAADLPAEDLALTGVGYVGGRLHVQMSMTDYLDTDDHGWLYLVDGEGRRTDCAESWQFVEFYYPDGTRKPDPRMEGGAEGTARVDYKEFVFDIAPEELAGCQLCGDFVISGLLTEGSWSVTFPLERAD